MSFIEGMDNGIFLVLSLISFTLLYIFYNLAKLFYNRIFGLRRTVYNVENNQEEDLAGEVECAICMTSEFKFKVELVCSHSYCGNNL